MKTELIAVLNDLNTTGLDLLVSEKREWVRVNDLIEINYNANACRFIANIIVSVDLEDAVSIFMYKTKFRMVRYFGVNHEKNTCRDLKETRIRTDIETEEEFFQESTIADLNDLEYDEYQLIKEIIDILDKNLWSVS